ncbi:MAG TPA: hypothetical protein VNM14_26265 [Planctomycetota bacterium]|nr:hypothetical protein [Planctomycetota bacterium]
MPEPADPVTHALREGWIPLGAASLRLGSTIRDAAEALGLDPERPACRWREVGGADGLRWSVNCGFLWSSPAPTMVELVFHDDALVSVQGADASWESSGTSWADFNPAIEIRNYWKTRKELEGRLGAPQHADERSEHLLVADWLLGGNELTLCWETRTPSLHVRIRRPRPRP